MGPATQQKSCQLPDAGSQDGGFAGKTAPCQSAYWPVPKVSATPAAQHKRADISSVVMSGDEFGRIDTGSWRVLLIPSTDALIIRY